LNSYATRLKRTDGCGTKITKATKITKKNHRLFVIFVSFVIFVPLPSARLSGGIRSLR